MKEGQTSDGKVIILYDPELPQTPDLQWFQPDWWEAGDRVLADLGGRGRARVVESPAGTAVLRRFCRGGLLGPVLRDRYLRTGPDRSRSFREFRVLADLRARNLPVPVPLAASYEPAGAIYRAALLTRRIPDTRQLAEVAAGLSEQGWSALGSTLQRFFRAGLVHPDLNARNILVDGSGDWYLLDMDRARVLGRPVSGQSMLARLRRSLDKTAAPGWQRGFERAMSGTTRA